MRERLDSRPAIHDTSPLVPETKEEQVPALFSDLALASVAQVTGLPAVRFNIDGLEMLGALDISTGEHERRVRAGLGAITSTALLHGLWLLPPGGSTPSGMLPEVKVQRLRHAPHTAVETDAGFERTYAPPGILRSVAFSGRSVARTVDRAARFTPIVQRFVLIDESQKPVASSTECVAREWGVGIISLRRGSCPEVLVPASPAETGIPSVYRWWVAELAYERYLYESTQPVS